MKKCITCGEEKILSEFGFKKRSNDCLQSKCLSCKRIYDNIYYKEKMSVEKRRQKSERNKLVKRSLYEMVNKIKLDLGCVDCGYKENPAALQFDHILKKYKDISIMIRHMYSSKAILEEIKQCEVRCGNCHLIKTAKDFSWYK